MGATKRLDVGIVPHTHWDREWYAPFPVYRQQLVHLVDTLLQVLEADDGFARFLLDGQTVLVDDYLEVRPEAEGRLARLAAAGRLQVGPWAVLMDEYMVSGETIVRDLQLGILRATQVAGSSMTVGYLPDMFGHVAQLPQLLRLAGLEHAVVWRGVPTAVDRTAFWWEAPDGTRVRAEYLYGSYSNGRELPLDPGRLVARARSYELELGPAALPGGGLLLMNGSDHLPPQRGLPEVVAAANAAQDRYRFSITSLPEYLATQPTDGLPAWRGELRSGARANVLMGVASNRVDVHQAAAVAERALERRAEPLSALLLEPDEYPERLLGLAWRDLLLNSAHDSSCACSHDDVVDAVLVRYRDALHTAEALAADALASLRADLDVPAGSVVVANGAAHDRAGTVVFPWPGPTPVHVVALDDGTELPAQVVRTRTGDGISTVVTGQKIRWVLEMMRGSEFAGARVARVERNERNGVVELTFHDAAPDEPAIDLEDVREELFALGDAGATIALRQRRATVSDVLVATGAVPGFGWRAFSVVEGAGPATAVSSRGTFLANEHVTVEVDPHDGTFTVDADGVRVEGCNRYVDGGDGGDTYNYSPPDDDTVVDAPESVHVEAVESGPVRARVVVRARYRVPAYAVGDERSCRARSDERVEVEITTTLELRTGERFLRIRTELDNRARDHRLRAHFPLPARVAGSDAECAFAVVRRGLVVEGGPHERPLPTFVSRRFVDCSDGDVGLALLHDGLLEYEVVGDGTELALTLLRATGFLSRAEPAYRPNPAGPLQPLEGPQLQRRLVLEYAVLPHRGDWRAARLHEAADDVLLPLECTRGTPGGRLPPTGRVLHVQGAQVSAVLREGAAGPIVVRLFNPSPEGTQARVVWRGQPARAQVVDLLGNASGEADGAVDFRPWEIVTLRLGDPA